MNLKMNVLGFLRLKYSEKRARIALSSLDEGQNSEIPRAISKDGNIPNTAPNERFIMFVKTLASIAKRK